MALAPRPAKSLVDAGIRLVGGVDRGLRRLLMAMVKPVVGHQAVPAAARSGPFRPTGVESLPSLGAARLCAIQPDVERHDLSFQQRGGRALDVGGSADD